MRQQINLYQPMFRREKKVFSSAAMVQLGLVVVVALVGIWGYLKWQTGTVEADLARLEAEKQSRIASLERLSEQYPSKRKSEALERRIGELRAELEAQREVSVALQRGDFGRLDGFSGHLVALARQHVPGTWITALELERGGRVVGLAGSALRSELVPLYIQRLGNEPVFAGLGFNVLELSHAEGDPVRVDFVLRTVPEG